MLYFQSLSLFCTIIFSIIFIVKYHKAVMQETEINILPYILLISIFATSLFFTLNCKNNTRQQNIIWNDDTESIPSDNSLITLEFTKNGVMYVGPYDKNAKHK